MMIGRLGLVLLLLLATGLAHAVSRSEITSLVRAMAPSYRLDPNLVLAVVEAESGFNPNARSPKNAQGLMQLIPGTAVRFGVKDAWDPEQNLRGGMAYLRWLIDYFGGDLRLALAGYNAGEKAVKRHRGIPPYPETQAYVRKIMRRYAVHQRKAAVASVTSDPRGDDGRYQRGRHRSGTPNLYAVDTSVPFHQSSTRENTMQTSVQTPVISQSPEDFGTPGVQVEQTAAEAEVNGAFEETALTEGEAWEANSDQDDPEGTAIVVNGRRVRG